MQRHLDRISEHFVVDIQRAGPAVHAATAETYDRVPGDKLKEYRLNHRRIKAQFSMKLICNKELNQ